MAAKTMTRGREIDYALLSKDLRKARHLTQEGLARELQVTFGTVNGWENRKHTPIPALASRLVALAVEEGLSPGNPVRSARRRKAGT